MYKIMIYRGMWEMVDFLLVTKTLRQGFGDSKTI